MHFCTHTKSLETIIQWLKQLKSEDKCHEYYLPWTPRSQEEFPMARKQRETGEICLCSSAHPESQRISPWKSWNCHPETRKNQECEMGWTSIPVLPFRRIGFPSRPPLMGTTVILYSVPGCRPREKKPRCVCEDRLRTPRPHSFDLGSLEEVRFMLISKLASRGR